LQNPELPVSADERRPEKKRMVIGMILAVVLAFACLLPYFKLLGIDTQAWQPDARFASMLLSRVLFWLLLGGIFLYAFRIEKSKVLLWREEKYSFGMYLAFFFITFAAVYVAMIVLTLVIRFAGLPTESTQLHSVTDLLFRHPWLGLFTCATAAVVEEFLFRGYLQPRLELLFGNRFVPVLISSVLFALLHFGFGTLVNIIGPLLIGSLFAIHYSYFRNIKFLIVFHFVWDVLMLYIAYRRMAHT
jgi:membrane protease YdiL (CAAX protease family)